MKHAKKLIKQIGCDPESIPIMAPKMIHHVIQLDNIQLQDAIIIKQDMPEMEVLMIPWISTLLGLNEHYGVEAEMHRMP